MDRGSLKLCPEPEKKISVKITDLRKELKELGGDYIQKVCVLNDQARENIQAHGLLAPLHDVMFFGSRVHNHYLQTGWMYSNTTLVLLSALVLAAVPWAVAALVHEFRLALAIIAVEFILATGAGWFVYCFTRADADLKEKFLTWLYENGKEV